MVFFKYLCLYCGHSILSSRRSVNQACPKCQNEMIFLQTISLSRQEIYELIESRR